MPSPVVRLNRAVAVAMAGDLDGGLAILDELEADGRLDGYYLLAATRADLLRRRGDGREPPAPTAARWRSRRSDCRAPATSSAGFNEVS